jgi:predicted metal-dependent hydrolase
MTSPKIDGHQLELFAQDFFASLEPSAKAPVAPQPLFKAPPAAPRVTFPVPPRGPDDPPLRKIVLGSHAVEFEFKRSTRRSIGFTIDDDGLRVTAPKRVTLAEVDGAIRAKQRWILSKLHERGERRLQRMQRPALRWEDGAQIPYMGGEITLRLEPAARSHRRVDAHARALCVGVVQGLQEWQLKERIRIWYHDEATRVFAERLDHYAERMGVSYKAFALSSAGTRWGSCTVGGHIRLNWRLIHYPLALIDYVVAHELAHLREMNHSAAFWATVGEVYPDYDGARLALRKRSHEMPVLFDD